jgi:hypothetical protein
MQFFKLKTYLEVESSVVLRSILFYEIRSGFELLASHSCVFKTKTPRVFHEHSELLVRDVRIPTYRNTVLPSISNQANEVGQKWLAAVAGFIRLHRLINEIRVKKRS